MVASLNKVMLIGRLGHDPEIHHTNSGQSVANFSIAIDENYTSRDGQKVEKTEWHRIVAWGKNTEFCINYLTKGRLVYIEGKIETRKWQDKNGVVKYTTEIKADRIVALDSKETFSSPHIDVYRPNDGFRSELNNAESIIDIAPF